MSALVARDSNTWIWWEPQPPVVWLPGGWEESDVDEGENAAAPHERLRVPETRLGRISRSRRNPQGPKEIPRASMRTSGPGVAVLKSSTPVTAHSCAATFLRVSRPSRCRNFDTRSAISRLFLSRKRKWVLPWMPISGVQRTASPAMLIERVHEVPAEDRTQLMAVADQVRLGARRLVVSIHDEDRDLGQLPEVAAVLVALGERVPVAIRQRSRNLIRGEDVAALEGDDAFDVGLRTPRPSPKLPIASA